jgi:hypothetical protein
MERFWKSDINIILMNPEIFISILEPEAFVTIYEYYSSWSDENLPRSKGRGRIFY